MTDTPQPPAADNESDESPDQKRAAEKRAAAAAAAIGETRDEAPAAPKAKAERHTRRTG